MNADDGRRRWFALVLTEDPMIQVTFEKVADGVCGWCAKSKEVFTVTFGDRSFVGPLCQADLLRAIRLKVSSTPKPEQKPVAAAVPVGNGAGQK